VLRCNGSCKQIASFDTLALVAPQPSKGGIKPKFRGLEAT
jgi:hypothetical protein